MTSLRQRLTVHPRGHWPTPAAVDVRYHGTFAHVTGRLPNGPMEWAFSSAVPSLRS